MEYIDVDDEKGLRDENLIDSEYVDEDEENFDVDEDRPAAVKATSEERPL